MSEALNLMHGDLDSVEENSARIQEVLMGRIGEQVIVIHENENMIMTVGGHLHCLVVSNKLGESVWRVYGNAKDWARTGARFKLKDIKCVYDGMFTKLLRIVL